MRWVGWIVGLIGIALFAVYVLWWQDRVNAEAANNDGMICTVFVQLDSELWDAYTSGNYLGAILGQYAAGPSDARGQELVKEFAGSLKDIEAVTGGKCLVSVQRLPMFQPGRIKVNVEYFRPYPAATP